MVSSLPSVDALSLFVGNWKYDVAVTYSQLKSLLHYSRNLRIPVRTAIRLRTGGPTHRDATPSKATTCVSSPNSPDFSWTHPALHGVHSRWKSGQGVTLSTHPHPVPKIRMRGAITPTATRLHIEIHNFELRVINFILGDPLL
jgi:hypothetical protein